MSHFQIPEGRANVLHVSKNKVEKKNWVPRSYSSTPYSENIETEKSCSRVVIFGIEQLWHTNHEFGKDDEWREDLWELKGQKKKLIKIYLYENWAGISWT